MSEFRYDWFSDRWVIFAPQRSHRPDEFANQAEEAARHTDCPFCMGNESETPVAVLMLPRTNSLAEESLPRRVGSASARNELRPKSSGRRGGSNRQANAAWANQNWSANSWDNENWLSSGWKVRVVPNKYPALKGDVSSLAGVGLSPELMWEKLPGEVDASKRFRESISDGPLPREPNGQQANCTQLENRDGVNSSSSSLSPELFQSADFHGAHEVFIECGEHKTTLTQLSVEHVQLILQSYAERLNFWRDTPGLRYGVIFKNSGAAAGATLSHVHSQLMATSFLPTEIRHLCDRWLTFQEKHHSCPVCDLMERELADSSRVVWESEHFVAICPFASRAPYFVSIYPKTHQPRFETLSVESRDELAYYLQKTLKTLENALTGACYNYVIHTAPFAHAIEHAHHWRLDLFPRLGKLAGFEWGSGSQINAILPEEAARTLRLYFATASV